MKIETNNKAEKNQGNQSSEGEADDEIDYNNSVLVKCRYYR
jgi:hypothetical protein